MEYNNNSRKTYIISILVLLLVMVISATSYAFFTATVNNSDNKNTVVTTGSMEIEFTDGAEISLENALPGSYIEKTFKVKNMGSISTVYDIYMSDLLNKFQDKSDLVYTLSSSDGGANISTQTQVPSESSKIVNEYPIGINEEHNYTLRIEFKETNDNQDDNKGKKFSTIIRINEIIDLPKNSVLAYLEDQSYNEEGEYEETIEINNQSYLTHIYYYNGDQDWTTSTIPNSGIFGSSEDVGTSSNNATKMVVVKVDGDLTIGSSVTIRPYYNNYGGPKGFMLYVTGTLTNNGTIDNSHGAKAVGQDVYLWENATYTNIEDRYEKVPAIGGTGAAKRTTNGANSGQAGTGRATGGGGGGYRYGTNATVGTGGNGTSYSGGAGSGSANSQDGKAITSSSGSSTGGAGSSGVSDVTGISGVKVGGVGNPTPASSLSSSSGWYTVDNSPQNGTGGLLVIYANSFVNNFDGKITAIGHNSGKITAKQGNIVYAGGSSGGGSINIFYNDNYQNNNNASGNGISAAGGARSPGGSGGKGTVTIGSIATGNFVANS